MKIAVTGHRPNKMPAKYGYNINGYHWQQLKVVMKVILKEYGCDEAYTGMALGVDMVFALAVLELKDEGYDIKLHCAIPCRNQTNKWYGENVYIYNKILKKSRYCNIGFR